MARGWFGDSEAHKRSGSIGGKARHGKPKGFAAMEKEEVQRIARESARVRRENSKNE